MTLKSLWNIITDASENIPSYFSIYPNPLHGRLSLQGLDKIKSVEVWDVTGRKIYPSHVYQEEKIFYLEIDPVPGIVIIKIETSDTVFYKKVNIQ